MMKRVIDKAVSAPIRVLNDMLGDTTSLLFDELFSAGFGLLEFVEDEGKSTSTILDIHFMIRRKAWQLSLGRTVDYSAIQVNLARDIIKALNEAIEMSLLIPSMDLQKAIYSAIVVKTFSGKARENGEYFLSALGFLQKLSSYNGKEDIALKMAQLVDAGSESNKPIQAVLDQSANFGMELEGMALISNTLGAPTSDSPLANILAINNPELI